MNNLINFNKTDYEQMIGALHRDGTKFTTKSYGRFVTIDAYIGIDFVTMDFYASGKVIGIYRS